MKIAIAIFALCATPVFAGALPPGLAKALKDYDRAHYQSDIPALTRLTSEDYTLLNSNMSLESKKQFLADFDLPGFKIEPYGRSHVMNVAWDDSAVTAGVVNLSWTQDGKHQTRRLRYIDVWRKQNGRWQVTLTQSTRALP